MALTDKQRTLLALLSSDEASARQKRDSIKSIVEQLPDEAMDELADTLVYISEFYFADPEALAREDAEWDRVVSENADAMDKLADKIREEHRTGQTQDLDIDQL